MVIDVARACGFQWADLPHKYDLATSAGLTLYVHLRSVCDEISPDAAEPGDLLLFWIRTRQHPQHLGILCGTTIVHASPTGTRTVNERRLGNYRNMTFAAFRYRRRGARPAHVVALNSHVKCDRCVLADPFKYARRNVLFDCKSCGDATPEALTYG